MIRIIQTEIHEIEPTVHDYEDYVAAEGVENPTEEEIVRWLWDNGYDGDMVELTVNFEEA